jgi:hypothetical protein
MTGQCGQARHRSAVPCRMPFMITTTAPCNTAGMQVRATAARRRPGARHLCAHSRLQPMRSTPPM